MILVSIYSILKLPFVKGTTVELAAVVFEVVFVVILEAEEPLVPLVQFVPFPLVLLYATVVLLPVPLFCVELESVALFPSNGSVLLAEVGSKYTLNARLGTVPLTSVIIVWGPQIESLLCYIMSEMLQKKY